MKAQVKSETQPGDGRAFIQHYEPPASRDERIKAYAETGAKVFSEVMAEAGKNPEILGTLEYIKEHGMKFRQRDRMILEVVEKSLLERHATTKDRRCLQGAWFVHKLLNQRSFK